MRENKLIFIFFLPLGFVVVVVVVVVVVFAATDLTPVVLVLIAIAPTLPAAASPPALLLRPLPCTAAARCAFCQRCKHQPQAAFAQPHPQFTPLRPMVGMTLRPGPSQS